MNVRSILSHASLPVLAAIVCGAVPNHLCGYTVSGGIYTTDGSQADVTAAIAASAAGSTVRIPAGSFVWGAGGSSVYVNKAITLTGAGPANTTITLDPGAPSGVNGTIQLYAAAVVGNFTVSAAASATAFSAAQTNGWRLTNVTYIPNGDSDYFFYISGSTGLIDSCNITGGGGSDELIFATGPTDSWQTPDSIGTANAVYVEDCTFNGPGYVCDANANARFVVRYCTITGQMKIDAHGFASNSPRGVRQIEIYRNRWTYGTNTGEAGFFPEMEIRGGTGLIFDNVSLMPANGSHGAGWLELRDYGYDAEWPNFGKPITSTIPGPGSATTIAAAGHGLQTGWTVDVQVQNSTPVIAGDYPVIVTNANTFTIPVTTTAAGTSGYVTTYQTPINYPIVDQIGLGPDVFSNGAYAKAPGGTSTRQAGGTALTASSDPMYVFDNIDDTVVWQLAHPPVAAGAIALYQQQVGSSDTFTDTDIIQPDRDVFIDTTVSGVTVAGGVVNGSFDGSTGVGRGTLAQMPSTASMAHGRVGVGYWATDQGSWNHGTGSTYAGVNGVLYVWNGAQWAVHYTPLTYPHPARAPAAPVNLRITSP